MMVGLNVVVAGAGADFGACVARGEGSYGGLGLTDTCAMWGVGSRFDSRMRGNQVGWGFPSRTWLVSAGRL